MPLYVDHEGREHEMCDQPYTSARDRWDAPRRLHRHREPWASPLRCQRLSGHSGHCGPVFKLGDLLRLMERMENSS